MAWLATAVAAVSLFGGMRDASAVQVACPVDFTADGSAKVSHAGVGGQLTAAGQCEYMSPPSSSTIANATTVNANAFFGHTDWAVVAGFSQVDANATSGSFVIGSATFASKDYMVVFKDGANTNLVGFLLNEETASIKWYTPFTDPPFNFPGATTAKAVSHYSVFERACTGRGCVGGGPGPGPDPVPAPATLALLGAGLVALGAFRRRAA